MKAPTGRTRKSRAKVVRPGRMPVSEFAFDRAGAGSPFGDDVVFPVPVDSLTYEHATSEHTTSEHTTSEHTTSEHTTSEHTTSEHATGRQPIEEPEPAAPVTSSR